MNIIICAIGLWLYIKNRENIKYYAYIMRYIKTLPNITEEKITFV